MDDDNVRSLNAARATLTNDNSLVSPLEMLECAARELRAELRDDSSPPPNKAVLLLLNDEDGRYDVHFYGSNIRNSEMIALLEVMKASFVKRMGY